MLINGESKGMERIRELLSVVREGKRGGWGGEVREEV